MTPVLEFPFGTFLVSTCPFQIFLLSHTILFRNLSPIRVYADGCPILNSTSARGIASAPFSVMPVGILTRTDARYRIVWSFKMSAQLRWNWTRWMIRVQQPLYTSRSDHASSWTTVVRAFRDFSDIPSGIVQPKCDSSYSNRFSVMSRQ